MYLIVFMFNVYDIGVRDKNKKLEKKTWAQPVPPCDQPRHVGDRPVADHHFENVARQQLSSGMG